MNIGSYLIEAGTLIGLIFRSTFGQQISQFLIAIGTALETGQGSVGPVRLGNEALTVTIAPWPNA